MERQPIYRLVIAAKQLAANQILLTEEQQHYLQRVLRMKYGERFIVMDGQGQTWFANWRGERAELDQVFEQMTELPLKVTVAVAVPKGNGLEQIIRCGTELGMSTLVPLLSDRTLPRPSAHKLLRWRKIAQESAEQSERQIVPQIFEPMSLVTWLERMDLDSEESVERYLCVAHQSASHLFQALQQTSAHHLVVATGPEGGWTTGEISQAIASSFQVVTLGDRVLRAVTAPIMALSLIAAISETSPNQA